MLDLLIAVGLWLLVLPVVALTEGVARVVLGVVGLLFVPGYTLIAALFPRKGSLDALERAALGFAVSLALTPIAGVALNFTPWGARQTPIMVSLTAIVIGAAAVAYYRRRLLPPGERVSVQLRPSLTPLRTLGVWNLALGGLLFLSATGAVATTGYVLLTPKSRVFFTEFYMTDVQGQKEMRPVRIAPGEPVSLILGIRSREDRELRYRVSLVPPTGDSRDIGEANLAPGKAWESRISFTLLGPGQEQKVMFLLYREGDTSPYRTLYIWVDVRGAA